MYHIYVQIKNGEKSKGSRYDKGPKDSQHFTTFVSLILNVLLLTEDDNRVKKSAKMMSLKYCLLRSPNDSRQKSGM